ncbi:MAG: type II toxin-antitoxin system HipA family toxin [Burkholderiales bacterium]|nr:type II toxin-antitoxin system HipA family toxin [Burkholderiales bacterium]
MQLYVIKNGKLTGTLTETHEGIVTFEYATDIAADQFLPGLADKVNTAQTLFPIFENLLPEHEQLTLLKIKHNITNKIGTLLYLDNVHGSFEFYNNVNDIPAPPKFPTFIYSQVKSDILESNYTFPNILSNYIFNIPTERLYPSGLTGGKITGISGYQYKFSVHKDDVHKRIYLDDNNESHYILKPNNLHYSKFNPKDKNNVYIPFLLVNEHVFMSFARDFGFDIPYNGIIKHDEHFHYIIKRYDRFQNMKIDHYELLSLLGKQSADKYSITCKEIIEKCKEYLAVEDLTKLFRFIVFSIIIGHGDLHAKNISLICHSNNSSETKMELAPLYDISTSSIYFDVDKNDIGLSINGKNKEITLSDLLWLASIADIPEDLAQGFIVEIATQFLETFEAHIDKLPSDIKELPFYARRSIYPSRLSLNEIFSKYYTNRCEYIEQHLSIKKKKTSIWD